MLGYKSLKQFLITYACIIIFAIGTFLVRLAKFEELGLEMQIDIFIVSLLLGVGFWESLRLTNYFLNKFYPFEENIAVRIVIQLLIGAVIGLIIRFIIYKWGEPHLPFRLDS